MSGQKLWFCRIKNKQYGPLSAQQLHSAVEKGLLSRSDAVKKGETGKWVIAGNVNGLFPPSQAERDAQRIPPKIAQTQKASGTKTEAYREEDHSVKASGEPSPQAPTPPAPVSTGGESDHQRKKRKVPRVVWIGIAGLILVLAAFGTIQLVQLFGNTPGVIRVDATRAIRDSFGSQQPSRPGDILLIVELGADVEIPLNHQGVYLEAGGAKYKVASTSELTSHSEMRQALVFAVPEYSNQLWLHIGNYGRAKISFDTVHDELEGPFR